MSYFFVKEYNSAYDKILTLYFRQHGISFDEETTFQEAWNTAEELKAKGAARIAADGKRKNAFEFRNHLAPHEILFWDYCYRWAAHQESRPAYLRFVKRILPVSADPDSLNSEEMRNIEIKFRLNEKILFSADEVANSFFEFYKKYLVNRLSKDLDSGGGSKKLIPYFSHEEVRALPNSSVAGEEEFEKEVYRRAADLWTNLGKVTPSYLSLETNSILKEHDSKPGHMHELVSEVEGEKIRVKTCDHSFSEVVLRGYREIGRTNTHLWLAPSRGYSASDYVIGEGWNSVVFPDYQVIGKESKLLND